MKARQHTGEQIIAVLKEGEAGAKVVGVSCSNRTSADMKGGKEREMMIAEKSCLEL